MPERFPLTPGAAGEAVRDLQRRLTSLGLTVSNVELGRFGESTAAAVIEFQRSRNLAETGECDEPTWSSLVEAGWRLGDRLLQLTAPNLRGDDVVDLQGTLTRLGFDCGRVDGIFGPDTEHALCDFQRNSGLPSDGVCGKDTVEALDLLRRQSGTGPGAVALREFLSLSTGDRNLEHLRVVVGHFGGLSALARQVVLALRQRSATVLAAEQVDPIEQAAMANRGAAHVYLGFEASPAACSVIHHFAVAEFESVAGRALAEHIAHEATRSPLHPEVTGVRIPILRETVMPAVLWRIGPVEALTRSAPEITRHVVRGLVRWTDRPYEN
ncbi:MAG: peptidoglycan-binding domain-containing protein [Ilumatobacteraceae bacterium]